MGSVRVLVLYGCIKRVMDVGRLNENFSSIKIINEIIYKYFYL